MARKSQRNSYQHRSKGAQSERDADVASTPKAVNALKSRIRDVSRALNHSEHLPPGARIEKERELAICQQDLEDASKAKARQQMIKKYHMVRFFERQKATRNLKKARNQLEQLEISSVQYSLVEKSVHIAEVDLNYTLFHPLGKKYISLFPKPGTAASPEPQVDPNATKPVLWKVVKSCMKEGTLEDLRDGRYQEEVRGPNTQHSNVIGLSDSQRSIERSAQQGQNRKPDPAAVGSDDDDDGFFEK